jgi:hypothetical protein
MQRNIALIFLSFVLFFLTNGCISSTSTSKPDSKPDNAISFWIIAEPSYPDISVTFTNDGHDKTYQKNAHGWAGKKDGFSYSLYPDLSVWKGLKKNIKEITLSKEGYSPRTIKLHEIFDSDLHMGKLKVPTVYYHPDKIFLTRKNDFHGLLKNPPKVILNLNSEPPGASIYNSGRRLGITPCSITYKLSSNSLNKISINTKPLIFYKKGYISQTKSINIKIDPEWKYYSGEKVSGGHNLTILKPDPAY